MLSETLRTRYRTEHGRATGGLPVRLGAKSVLRTIAAVGAQAGEVLEAGLKRYLPRGGLPRPLDEDHESDVATASGFPPWTRRSFGLAVVVPTVLAAMYFFLIASDQYVAEARFAVRGATQKLASSPDAGRFGGALSMLADLNSNQEAYIVVSYIQSARIIEDLNGELDLKAMFAWPAGDFIAAFNSSGTREQLFDYWLGMVTAEVEAMSGIATVKVTTFSASDSLRLANAILARCEQLVNDFVDRVRIDTMQRAEDDLRRAGQQVAAAQNALRDFRESHRYLDPTGSAKSLFDTITQLRQSRIAAETELSAARSQLADTSPRIRELRARAQILGEQIRKLEAQLTQAEGDDPRKASEAIRAYELLLFDAKMASDVFKLAETALTDARTNLEKHHVYLETYLRPTLPEAALYPRPMLGTFAVFASTLMIWLLVVLAAAAIRSHVD
jgi:capsular polysaccharide transport system permease protein